MKYIKRFESINDWDNIIYKDNKTFVRIWGLAKEMETSVIDKGKDAIAEKESEFFKLVKKLLLGKVITFDSDYNKYGDDDKFTGICQNVSFEGDYHGSSYEDGFLVAYMFITLEDKDEYGMDDDLVVIHNDIDPDLYRETSKYNL